MFKDFKLRTIKKLLTLDLKIEHCSEKIQLAIQCFQRSINMQKKGRKTINSTRMLLLQSLIFVNLIFYMAFTKKNRLNELIRFEILP